MNDDEILAGFASLHHAMATGFDTMSAEFRAEIRAEIGGLRNEMHRRFDRVEDRLDDHERRIRNLEARAEPLAAAAHRDDLSVASNRRRRGTIAR